MTLFDDLDDADDAEESTENAEAIAEQAELQAIVEIAELEVASEDEHELPPQGDPLAPEVAEANRDFTYTPERRIATREYYSISEVCDLVGLKPHVLRYWETQFAVLNPSKNRSGNRVYQRKEIKLILLVKHLLYKEKYTIDGAKQRLEQLRKGGELNNETARALDTQMIEMLTAELQQIVQFLTPVL